MKKATILMALVLLLSICGVGVLAADVFEAHDQVVLTEQVIYGDRSKANGLTAQINSQYQNKIFWNTTLVLSEATQSRSEYSFSAKRMRENYPEEYSGLRFSNRASGGVDFDLEAPQDGLWLAYKELYDETGPGQEKGKDILLKDYIDYYPMTITLDFPNARYGAEAWESFEGMDVTPGSEAYAIQVLRDHLKIPVLEDEHYGIHVRKREDGTQGGWGGGTSQYGDGYNMWDYSVLADDACYFTFSTLSDDGKIADISQLPDGYGIYRLPYHTEYDELRKEEVSIIDADSLEMVYPLTPGIDLSSLSINEEQTCLYLHAVEDGKYSITVIELSTMRVLQKLDVLDVDEESAWGLCDQDDFMVIEFYHTQELAVMSKAENGELKLEYICPMMPDGVGSFSMYNAAMDFDGERLVFCRQIDIEIEHGQEYRDRTSCGIQVAVYEADGLVYLGEYKSSLDTGEDWADHSFYVRGKNFAPVAVTCAS